MCPKLELELKSKIEQKLTSIIETVTQSFAFWEFPEHAKFIDTLGQEFNITEVIVNGQKLIIKEVVNDLKRQLKIYVFF
jgi:hypothetical protein